MNCILRSSAGHFAQRSRTVCAILVEGIIRNISLNYFKFGPVVQKVMSLKTLLALAAILISKAERFVQFS